MLKVALIAVVCTTVVARYDLANFHEEPEVNGEDLEVVNRFRSFAQRHNKVYRHIDHARSRFHVYKRNLANLEELRARMASNSDADSAVFGETKFMDVSPEEFRRTHLNGMLPLDVESVPRISEAEMFGDEVSNEALPKEFDWRQHGAVSPVKDQGNCGCCWAFSVIAFLESQYMKTHNGQAISLSEQFLIDCDTRDQNCYGGKHEFAYKQILKLGGVPTDKTYPYKAVWGQCKKVKDESLVVHLKPNSTIFLVKNERSIQRFMLHNGPVAVAMNAHPMQQYYNGGIFRLPAAICPPNQLNHAILLVGWGETPDGTPYWIIKNTWGSGWGEAGYMRMYRGENVCGIAEYATFVSLLKDK